MIWPEFTDDNGDAIPKETPLKGTLNARMHILNQEMKTKTHVPRIKLETEFYSMEGSHKVAKGIITKITGLAESNENQ